MSKELENLIPDNPLDCLKVLRTSANSYCSFNNAQCEYNKELADNIEQALIQANQYLGARRNSKTLAKMYQLVLSSEKLMKPALWIGKIDGKLEQRVVMEKEDYDKLEDKVQAQEEALKIILEEPYQCAPTILYIQINKDNPKMLNYEYYVMSVKAPLSKEDFERLVRYVTNGKAKD